MTIADKLALLEQTKEAQRVKLGLLKSTPFSQYVKFMRDPFIPTELFANSEQGVWLDPSDLSTMFQDARGISPVTKDGDPVGLILDKSQGIQAESLLDKSYPFEMFDGTIREGEVIHLQKVGSGISIRASNLSIKKDAMYRVSFYVESLLGGVIVPRLNNSTLGSGGTVSEEGYYETYIRSSQDGNLFQLNHASNGIDAKIRDISVQEVKGNHATQPTASARPIYRTDGELHWLEFDGTDDYLVTTVKQYAEFSYYTAASSFYNTSLQVIMGGRSSANNRSHIGHQRGSVAAGIGELQGLHLQIVEQFTQDSIVLGSLVYDTNTVGLRQNKIKTLQVDISGTPLPPQDNFIGALSTRGTPSSYLKGSIYGIIAVNSAEYKEDATNYLAKKIGVTL